ncbi:unnamed protein product [Amoebophrya sp. A120]|nr:unnamed protein product [Amoebophrya sp. A120]|eukprot:GSA120T00006560001.1
MTNIPRRKMLPAFFLYMCWAAAGLVPSTSCHRTARVVPPVYFQQLRIEPAPPARTRPSVTAPPVSAVSTVPPGGPLYAGSFSRGRGASDTAFALYRAADDTARHTNERRNSSRLLLPTPAAGAVASMCLSRWATRGKARNNKVAPPTRETRALGSVVAEDEEEGYYCRADGCGSPPLRTQISVEEIPNETVPALWTGGGCDGGGGGGSTDIADAFDSGSPKPARIDEFLDLFAKVRAKCAGKSLKQKIKKVISNGSLAKLNADGDTAGQKPNVSDDSTNNSETTAKCDVPGRRANISSFADPTNLFPGVQSSCPASFTSDFPLTKSACAKAVAAALLVAARQSSVMWNLFDTAQELETAIEDVILGAVSVTPLPNAEENSEFCFRAMEDLLEYRDRLLASNSCHLPGDGGPLAAAKSVVATTSESVFPPAAKAFLFENGGMVPAGSADYKRFLF